MISNKWKIKEIDLSKADYISSVTGIKPLISALLTARGIDSPEAALRFLDKSAHSVYDPFLLKDMDKAVERIRLAEKENQTICIYGDYDVDGVTATTVLYKYLTDKGIKCDYFIPERISEGYGLNSGVIERLSGKIDLIITVDTGVTAVSETEFAKQKGIDMIITDHHRYRDVLPAAVAVVNPHRSDCGYPFKQLAGVGVVFKLVCALEGERSEERVMKKFGDIIALGTIADVMPIIDENRYIAQVGLDILRDTTNPGLIALMNKSGVFKDGKRTKKLSSTTVGYVIAPRINAAGRITSARHAVSLLLSDDPIQAEVIAQELCDINKQRQITETEIFTQAVAQMDSVHNDDSILVLHSDGWHQGVIGVVASRITEKYSLPSILFSFDGNIGKGSGRSIKGFNIMEALEYCKDLLLEYGGHELAAGISIERSKLEQFRKRINEYGKSKINKEDMEICLEADCVVESGELNVANAKDILCLEPFGLRNPVPVFVMKNVIITDVASLGGGKHTRFRVNTLKKAKPINAVCFGCAFSSFTFNSGDTVDIAFTLEINDYYGVDDIQLFIKGIRPCEKDMREIEAAAKTLEMTDDINNFEPLPEGSIPTLTQFRDFFRFLKHDISSSAEQKTYTVIGLKKSLEKAEETSYSITALKIIIDVLVESGLIKTTFAELDKPFEISMLPYGTKKIDLDNSATLSRIRANHKK